MAASDTAADQKQQQQQQHQGPGIRELDRRIDIQRESLELDEDLEEVINGDMSYLSTADRFELKVDMAVRNQLLMQAIKANEGISRVPAHRLYSKDYIGCSLELLVEWLRLTSSETEFVSRGKNADRLCIDHFIPIAYCDLPNNANMSCEVTKWYNLRLLDSKRLKEKGGKLLDDEHPHAVRMNELTHEFELKHRNHVARPQAYKYNKENFKIIKETNSVNRLLH